MNQPSTQAGEGTLKRPDPDDIIWSELNLERWPGLWATRDTDDPRTLHREISYPDGSKLTASLNISSDPGSGTLTTETLRYYTALLKLRQDAWGPRAENAPADRRMFFSLRLVGKLLRPGRSKDASWGGQTLASSKRHIRKLANVRLRFNGSYWDAKTQQRRGPFEGGFSIISDYFIAEERRFQKGKVVQLPLEFGYVRLNPWVEDNLARHYTAPVYFSERMAIGAPFAQQLYSHLNLMMAGQDRYERRVTALFEQDFPEMGTKYPKANHRRRVLERNLEPLRGRKITSGVLATLRVQKTAHGSDWKLVVVKEPFRLELAAEVPTGQPATQEVVQPSSSEIRKTITAPLRDARERRQSTPSDPRKEAFLDELVAALRDPESRRNYHHIYHDLGQAAESILRKWLREIELGEHDGLGGSPGLRLQVLYKQFCQEQGRAPYWRRPGRENRPVAGRSPRHPTPTASETETAP
jgi:hypothetical protein